MADPTCSGAFALADLQAAFGTGLVLGAGLLFALGVLVGLAWATIRKQGGNS
jgi:hypothetical protein